MTGAWSVCVQLGARVMAGAIVMLLSGGIGKLNILRESDFSPHFLGRRSRFVSHFES